MGQNLLCQQADQCGVESFKQGTTKEEDSKRNQVRKWWQPQEACRRSCRRGGCVSPWLTGCHKHHTAQQKQSPTSTEGGPHALEQMGEQLVGVQVWRVRPEGPAGHEIEHDPAMDPCSKEGQNWEMHCQQVE